MRGVVLLLSVLLAAAAGPANAASFRRRPVTLAEGVASSSFQLVNSSRSAAGLPALDASDALTTYAVGHSTTMASQGTIFHSAGLGSITSGWSAMGENVGMGPSASIIHQGFMASPTHAANILGDWTHLGVGAVMAEDGTLYVTQIFMKKTTTTTTVASTTTVAVADENIGWEPPPSSVPPPTRTSTPEPVYVRVPALCGREEAGDFCLG